MGGANGEVIRPAAGRSVGALGGAASGHHGNARRRKRKHGGCVQ